MPFENVYIWSEFPEKVDWKKAKELLDFPVSVYIAASSKKEFLKWKRKAENKYISCGVWPTISKQEGYWFSSYCSKESIKKLLEFKGERIKVDLEPPIPNIKKYAFWPLVKYSFQLLQRKAKEKQYLHQIIQQLPRDKEVILSGLPLPIKMRGIYGDDFTKLTPNMKRNFFIYSTLYPKWIYPIIKIYYRIFLKRDKKFYGNKLLCAVGCIGPGIFGTEPIYRNINEFRADLLFVEQQGIKNIVIFELGGILKRDNPQAWINLIKQYTQPLLKQKEKKTKWQSN